MAVNRIQVISWRVLLSITLSILLVGCISSQPFPEGPALAQPIPTPIVRAPKVGQEWVYRVRNVFNQEIIDTITERVVSVGEVIRIQRVGVKAGPLPDEIQSPWGYVLQDPHWTPPQKFQQPIPLWPSQLQAGWNAFYKSRYEVLSNPGSSFYWGLNMTALGWEQVSSPAGLFPALHYHNEIPYFESNDLFRVMNIREEDVWFSPEIGRWAIRRGSGRYITPGVFWSNAYWEDYWQWELVSWK